MINDLDLFLMPKGSTSTDPYNDAIWTSAQDFMPLEHMFIQIPATGEYEIWVEQIDNELGGGQDYAIAWWAVGTGPLLSGDFDSDGDVDGTDFLAWQQGFGGAYGASDLTDWENNFGNTGAAIAAAGAVPEPSSMLLLLVGLFFAKVLAPRERPKNNE